MKPADVKSTTFINFNVENNDKDPKFKDGNIKTVRNIKAVWKRLHSKFFWSVYD